MISLVLLFNRALFFSLCSTWTDKSSIFKSLILGVSWDMNYARKRWTRGQFFHSIDRVASVKLKEAIEKIVNISRPVLRCPRLPRSLIDQGLQPARRRFFFCGPDAGLSQKKLHRWECLSGDIVFVGYLNNSARFYTELQIHLSKALSLSPFGKRLQNKGALQLQVKGIVQNTNFPCSDAWECFSLQSILRCHFDNSTCEYCGRIDRISTWWTLMG